MKDDNIIGWFSLDNGAHVPIKKGESKREATSKFINKKMSRVQKNKDKYDTIDTFKKRKATNKLEEYEPKKKGKIHLIKDKDNRYIVSRGEDDNEAIENYKRKYGDEKERNEANEPSRREKLMKFTQENKEQIKKWGEEYDEETNRQAFEKAKQGEGLTAKEYFGFIGSDMKPGSVLLEQFADGENAVVAKDGNWVRESRIKAYNNNPRANQDAIYDDEKEERLKQANRKPLPTLEELRNSYKDVKNPFRDDEFTRKELEKEKISRFREQKQSNIKTKNEKETYEKNYNNIMNWEKEGNNYNIKARASVGGYGETTFVFSKQDNNRKDIAHYKITLDKLGKMSEKEIKDVLSNVEKKLR